MRPILCVIDGTESSVRVLDVATRLANAYHVQLTILFPYRLIDVSPRGDVSSLKVSLEEHARQTFQTLKKDVLQMDHTHYEFKPEIGFAGYIVNSYIRRNKVDMVVIGQQQANSINEVNDFSLQTLISTSKTPFTIVPEGINVEAI